jgi:hypothetical protein
MSEQRNTAVLIGQLNMRIPGDNADAGHRAASGIAQGLASKVPASMQRHLGALSVRAQMPTGASEAEMSDVIAEAIVRTLRRKTGRRTREVNE